MILKKMESRTTVRTKNGRGVDLCSGWKHLQEWEVWGWIWKDVGAGKGVRDPCLWADLCSYSDEVFPPPDQREKQFLQ